MTQPIHLMIGTPCYGGNVTHVYLNSIVKLQRLCLMRGIGFDLQLLSGDALITRARNTIVTQFLDHPNATHLLFIDADIGFDPQAVFDMIEFGRDLVGGIYPVKTVDWDLIAKNAEAKHTDLRHASLNYVVSFGDATKLESIGHFARAQYLGNGFMLITRRVFEIMKQKYPELRYKSINTKPDPQLGSENRYSFFDCITDAEGCYLSEDYAFCKRWLDAGGEIWADITSRLNHFGPFNFRGDTTCMFPTS